MGTFTGRRVPPGESLIDKLKGALPAGPAGAGAPADPAEPAARPKPFAAVTPRTRLADLVLPDEVHRQVRTLLSRYHNRDLIYREWEMVRIDPRANYLGVNLYGRPGTGKTSLAEALANELGRPIIEVDCAELVSKYPGDTAKAIRRAFHEARAADAVLFFDEAADVLRQRGGSSTDVGQDADLARSELLKQLDKFDGCVVFATNLFQEYDRAAIRRIHQHIEVPPPGRAGRRAIWERMLSPRIPGRDQIDFEWLADASDGLAGGDIKNAVLIALPAVAAKDPAERRLERADLEAALRDVRGAALRDAPVVTQQVIDPKDAPPDVARRFAEARAAEPGAGPA